MACTQVLCSLPNQSACCTDIDQGLALQVSVYDTINKDAQYSLKVRRLGEYHSGLAATKDQEGQDIGDPLYGNAGGVDELVGILLCSGTDSFRHLVLDGCLCTVYLDSMQLCHVAGCMLKSDFDRSLTLTVMLTGRCGASC